MNVYAKIYQNVTKCSRDRASFTFLIIWTSAKTRPTTNGIEQSLGLDRLNINDYAKFHQKIPHASRSHVTHEKMMFLIKNVRERPFDLCVCWGGGGGG